MHRFPIRPLLAVPLLLIAAEPAAAQERTAPRPTFYAGLALGAHDLPDSFEGCVPQNQLAGEVRAGLSFGRWALEGRASALANASEVCLDPLRLPPPDGIQDEREYDYRLGDSNETADLRLRFGGADGLPLTVAAGGGWLEGPDVPYLLASVGFRTGGRVRLGIDAEADWYRVGYREVTREWQNGQLVHEEFGEEHATWWRGVGIRIGAELSIR